jgi:hypothetical protein
MKLTTKLTAVALVFTGAISGAQATALLINTPTTSVAVSGTFFGGSLVAHASTNINNLSYQGIARTEVYDTGTGLDFYYQFASAPTSKNGVERFSGWDFSALGTSAVDVFQTNASNGFFTVGTEASDSADRSASVIGFSFVPNGASKINPGTTSFVQVIRTNARNYQAGNFGLLDGIGDNATGFGLAAAVPEPETYAMMLAGLGLMGAIIRRRKSKQA